MPLLIRVLSIALIGSLAEVGSAQAHAYGERYDLPVPLWLNLVGGAAVVVLSFVIAALLLSSAGMTKTPRARRSLLSEAGLQARAWRMIVTTARVLSVCLLALAVLTGFFGKIDFSRNAAPTIVWAMGWVGLAFACALVGNVWLVLNPWLALFDAAQALWKKLTGSARLSLALPYPEAVGIFPGILLMVGFVWFMLASGVAGEPFAIAAMLTIYSAVTWTGMMLFGPAIWIARGEIFTLIAIILGRFAPIELRSGDVRSCLQVGCPPDAEQGCSDCPAAFYASRRGLREVNLRPYGAGLVVARPLSASMTILVVMVLALVSFEGLMDTAQWIDLMVALGEYEYSDGIHAPLKTTLLFVTATGLLYGIFYVVSALMRHLGYADAKKAGGIRLRTTAEVMGLFVLSLVPIALAYHIAHYLYWFATNIQYVIPAASDPFAWGWNLFGARDYIPNRTAVSLAVIWHTAVAAIVIGHVVGVWVAHRVALMTFHTRRSAFASQIPMLVLMVAYTMSSLWMLAQPIMG
ncbi:MAG TPA: hypothetical protein VHN20_04260 [Beijerinckiaceae bacterium]|nr:hypothetical protein [Beijerinckiaceae bacterium]